MQIGMVGLGRMGGNMARRLLRGGHEVVAYATDATAVRQLAGEGAVGALTLDDFVARLKPPRVAWVMVPAGPPTEQVVTDLARRLDPGDTLIDGGNSYFKDDVRRSRTLRERRINFVDVGTSGGVWGLERGYCLMIGGDRAVVARLDPIFRTLAPGVDTVPRTPGRERSGSPAEHGYLYCGPSGAGHFVKMVHNGIEYGLMQAYAEGLDIMKNANSKDLPEELRYDLDLADIAELWRRGSVVSSWLLDLTAQALAENPTLSAYTGVVADSGEGRWTIMAALEEAVPCDVLAASLFARFRSRREHTFAETGLVGALVAEELDEPLRPATRGGRARYVVCIDPVDGSSNLDVNGIVGTIFSIRRSAGAGDDTRQPGTAQVAAGYIMYGPATLMVLTTGDGVDGFTLDPTSGEFVRSHHRIRIPDRKSTRLNSSH